MNNLDDYLLFALALFALWLSARIGSFFHKRRQKLEEDMPEDFGVILTATLTLLGLIIGFSFSVAIGRYEQRKNYEEEEANAIGTEYGPISMWTQRFRRLSSKLLSHTSVDRSSV
jgi:hypothetical protein